MALADLSERLGPNVREYLNLDFFDNEFNKLNEGGQNNGLNGLDEGGQLRESIERLAVPMDWKPDCNVHLYHGSADTYVPVSCSEELAAYLQSVGAQVDYVTTETGHWENGISMASEMAKFLYK